MAGAERAGENAVLLVRLTNIKRKKLRGRGMGPWP